jgi:CubicO group peptidase (beta-lactamase class C family)
MTEHVTTEGSTSPLPESLAQLRGTVLVRRGGADLLSLAGGTSGGADDAAITTGTRFQVASVSKQFTAAAALLLVDRGALTVDDRLVDVLEGGPPSWKAITVHQLLCHTSGLAHWRELPELDLTASIPAEELLTIFRAAPLLSEPGERYSYSSLGYVLLAHVVERVSGTPYRVFLADELFSPLGLDSTFAGNAGAALDVATPLHRGEPVASFELDVVGMGAGDLWSTVGDLLTWDDALVTGRILSEESRREMFTPHAAVEEDVPVLTIHGYGYGWFLAELAGHRITFHTGDNAGFQSINAFLPDDRASFAALTNDASTDLIAVSLELLALAMDDAP